MPEQSTANAPRSVKSLFAEMKDVAELIVDLSYSSILYNNKDVAEEVLRLEKKMDDLQLQARKRILLAARSKDEADQLAPLLAIIGATEDISNAAGDIAEIVTEETDIPADLRRALPEAFETIVQATVSSSSDCVGKPIGETLSLQQKGIKLLTIRRESSFITDPTPDMTLKPEDQVIMRGHEKELFEAYRLLTGEEHTINDEEHTKIAHVKKAVQTIIQMKNVSEVAVDMSYSSVLSNSRSIAEEVSELESLMDKLQDAIETWVLQAAPECEDPNILRGLITLATAAENISDAALEISAGVIQGLPIHPVFQEAIEQSEETFARLEISQDSKVVGQKLGEHFGSGTEGVTLVAIRRNTNGEAEWILSPDSTEVLRPGDTVIAKGPPTAIKTFRSTVSG